MEVTEVYSHDDPNASDVIAQVANYANHARAMGLPFWIFAEERKPIGMVVFGREPIQLLAPVGTLMSFILVADPQTSREKIREFASEALDFVKRTKAQYALAAFPHEREEAIAEFESLGFKEIDDCYEMIYKIDEPFEVSDKIQFNKVERKEIQDFVRLAKEFLSGTPDSMLNNTLKFILELPDDFLDVYYKIEDFYFIKEGEKTVGIVNFDPRTGRISNVGISPKYRRQGYGEQAVRFALNKLLQNNVKQAYLRVHVKNKAAINLYKKIGFLPETRIKTLIWRRTAG